MFPFPDAHDGLGAGTSEITRVANSLVCILQPLSQRAPGRGLVETRPRDGWKGRGAVLRTTEGVCATFGFNAPAWRV